LRVKWYRLVQDVAVTGPETTDGYNVDGDAKKRFDGLLDVHQVEKGTTGFEFDKEIYVARFGVVASGHGPEERYVRAAMSSNDVDDRVTVRLENELTPCHDNEPTNRVSRGEVVSGHAEHP